ncbi:sarcosine oxidase subunit delta [Rhodobacteraceae bacterium NNCM2]|nr:sarcosine oxidase subunit delta [Coraliihabitans acroporae]
MRIRCPFCGERDHSEFTYVDVASVEYPALDASEDEWFEAVFLRDNPRGPALELWQHSQGCRAFIVVERDTLTHEISSVRMAHPGMQAACEGSGK